MANAICIITNKGYYYIPHFVKSIAGNHSQDTALLNKYLSRHEVLTHISDDVFEVVISGMQDVVDRGYSAGCEISGINICAKTGTSAKIKWYWMEESVELKDNSMFVCFAPRENPTIAITVVIENDGTGATACR